MSKHDPKNQQTNTGCKPQVECPRPPGTDETCQGTIQGTVTMECCCPRLYTRTYILNIGPQSEANLMAFLQNTATSYENAGYLVLAHSVADIGAGWMFGLTVGWYA